MRATPENTTLMVVYEDRPTDLIALKLLALSLARHCPDIHLRVVCPVATPDMERWLRRQPNVECRCGAALQSNGYDVKPTLLREALEEGRDEVWWVDSDIIFNGDFRKPLGQLDHHTFVGTQEVHWGARQGTRFRTWGHGYSIGRCLPHTINSCLLRFTKAHLNLLHDWEGTVRSERYQKVQQLPWRQRPLYMITDQDCLNALLGSSKHAHIPVHLLRRGRDIIQNGGPAGYTVGERLANVTRGGSLPAVVHMQGLKPWNFAKKRPIMKAVSYSFERLALQLSPYCQLAAQYRDAMDEPAAWFELDTAAARWLDRLTLGSPHLRGLPCALVDAAWRRVKRLKEQWCGESASIQPMSMHGAYRLESSTTRDSDSVKRAA
ncbi:MAG: nucleotide-diphospho-sugar transferase [Firmicutes bacterium]|nr:nucleotide-diphospho-sugar transferase [Bacillota bacterium]